MARKETARFALALTALAASIAQALEQRDEAQQMRAVREGELLTLRAATRELAEELESRR